MRARSGSISFFKGINGKWTQTISAGVLTWFVNSILRVENYIATRISVSSKKKMSEERKKERKKERRKERKKERRKEKERKKERKKEQFLQKKSRVVIMCLSMLREMKNTGLGGGCLLVAGKTIGKFVNTYI